MADLVPGEALMHLMTKKSLIEFNSCQIYFSGDTFKNAKHVFVSG